MAEVLILEEQPAPDPNPNPCEESDPLAIPPLDPMFFSATDPTSTDILSSDLDFLFDYNGDFDFNFDGLDDLYLPPDTDHFLIPTNAQDHPGDLTPDSGISGISGDLEAPEDVNRSFNCVTSESGGCNRESLEGSDDTCSDTDRTLNVPSSVLYQGSGDCVPGVTGATNASCPDSSNLGSVQKVEMKQIGKNSVPKRKKAHGESNGESRSCKFSRLNVDAAVSTDQEEKKKFRLMRNRESAQSSRQRKKQYVEELEGKVKTMHSTIAELNRKISYIMYENADLRQRLSGGAAIYPTPIMPYPWVPTPYAPYAVKNHGVVAIPKLKTPQPASASKPKNAEKKSKTKKIASISFLGLLFFIFLFTGIFPLMNVRYGGVSENFNSMSDYVNDRFCDKHRGKVLMVNGHWNGSDSSPAIRSGYGGSCYHAYPLEQGLANAVGNASEPLFASVYVPRNDKLVKIDGNLIVHSVLAGQKAMASKKSNKNLKNGFALSKEISPVLAIPDIKRNGKMVPDIYRNADGHAKAISSGSAVTKKLHQWLSEDGTVPMLSSGLCTEVFQFDVSSPGSIIPSPSAFNISSDELAKRKTNRRILQGLPLTLTGSDNHNITRDKMGKKSQKENFQGNKTASSMVVSVLVDPREAGDADVNGMMTPNSISRIFVVVLMDSVKYVTYSCVLPRSGIHLVTT